MLSSTRFGCGRQEAKSASGRRNSSRTTVVGISLAQQSCYRTRSSIGFFSHRRCLGCYCIVKVHILLLFWFKWIWERLQYYPWRHLPMLMQDISTTITTTEQTGVRSGLSVITVRSKVRSTWLKTCLKSPLRFLFRVLATKIMRMCLWANLTILYCLTSKMEATLKWITRTESSEPTSQFSFTSTPLQNIQSMASTMTWKCISFTETKSQRNQLLW